MQNRTKFIIGCLMLTGLGFLLSVIGFVTGGTVYGIQIDARGLHVAADSLEQEGEGKWIEKEETVDAFDSISIDMEYLNVILTASGSGDYRVSYSMDQSDGFQYKVEDRTLIIGQKENTSWVRNAAFFSIGNIGSMMSESKGRIPAVTVYVPKNETLAQVEVQTESGNITCLDLETENMILNAEYGDIEIENVWAQEGKASLESGDLSMKQVRGGSFAVDNEYGDFVLEDIVLSQDMSVQLESGDMEYQNVAMRDLKLENSYGEINGQKIKLRNLYAELESGNCNFNSLTLDSCEVEAEYGNVEMGLVRPLEDYSYDLNVEYGEITLDGKREGSSYHSLGDEKKHQINIFCESGDIILQKVTD